MKNHILVTLSVIVGYFIIFSFVQSELNPFAWDINVRAGYSLVTLISSIVANVTYKENEERKKYR